MSQKPSHIALADPVSEKNPMLDQPTLGRILASSISDENWVGSGDRNAVFAIDGCQDYLIRVPLRQLHGVDDDGIMLNLYRGMTGEEETIEPKESLYRALTGTSALTPPREIYTPRNVSQPLLTLAGPLGGMKVQIIERQQGQSLHDVAAAFNKKHGKAPRHIVGYQHMAEQLIQHGPEGLKPLLIDWYHLIGHNKKPSSNLENVFYNDADGCRCIDIFDHIDKVKFALHPKPLPAQHVEKRLAHRCTRLIEHFEKALHQPGAFDTPEEAQGYRETLQRLDRVLQIAREEAIAEVKHQGPAFQKVGHIGAVKLDGDPAQMIAVLDQLKTTRQASLTR